MAYHHYTITITVALPKRYTIGNWPLEVEVNGVNLHPDQVIMLTVQEEVHANEKPAPKAEARKAAKTRARGCETQRSQQTSAFEVSVFHIIDQTMMHRSAARQQRIVGHILRSPMWVLSGAISKADEQRHMVTARFGRGICSLQVLFVHTRSSARLIATWAYVASGSEQTIRYVRVITSIISRSAPGQVAHYKPCTTLREAQGRYEYALMLELPVQSLG